MKKSILLIALVVVLASALAIPVGAASPKSMIGINVLLKTEVTNAILADLSTHGNVRDIIYEIKAVTIQARAGELDAIRALPYVAAANPDAERSDAPVAAAPITDFSGGVNSWDLDAINVTDLGSGRTLPDYDGSGVYVAVLDTGLVDNWRFYFPAERIATQYGASFGGGGGDIGNVSTQPNKWEHDQNSHGTHVTSTILGYNMGTRLVNGVAPKATVIPVKVLNQNGSGWSSVIARGIVYVANLKEGPLADYPVVINMSLGGPVLDALEQAAIDYAVDKGVIIVASAGNRGTRGMSYPGAYAPVISVAASGWVGEWSVPGPWWRMANIPDPTVPADFYITDFSSRQLAGQDLDVAAPGSWVVGPYQTNGQLSFYYLGGTSMASPHVAGIVALMAQKNPGLVAAQAEDILEDSAIALAPGCRDVNDGSGTLVEYCWEADATGAGLITADAALAATP